MRIAALMIVGLVGLSLHSPASAMVSTPGPSLVGPSPNVVQVDRAADRDGTGCAGIEAAMAIGCAPIVRAIGTTEAW